MTMRDVPMLDVDRERMRLEFDDFDSMTPDQFRLAVSMRMDELLDLYNTIGDST